MGPLRHGTQLLIGSGRFPTLSDWRQRARPGQGPTARGLRVFAVEPTAVQLDWAALGPGEVSFRCADTHAVVEADGGPGVVELDGLPTGRALTITVAGAGVPRTIELPVTTPSPPPGEVIARIATISDSHIGESTFGYLHTIGEPRNTPPDEAHSVRAVRAALRSIEAWGADRLICKGDIVDQSHPAHWKRFLGALGTTPLAVHLIPGNHEVKRRRSVEAADALAGSKVHYTDHLDSIDLGGASLVLANSTIVDHERGRLGDIRFDLLDALRATEGGALVAIHHHLRNGRAINAWPVGVPTDEADAVLDDIVAVHPATMITSGHVHRNRLRRHGPLVLTCVGSVKDYPGVWAGYVFHEGGIRQVVRRVGDPSVLAWTERTGDALGGFYRYWTPSTLAKRCPVVTWPR